MIKVLDYGMGNVGAVLNMLQYLGIAATTASKPADLAGAQKLILPGVGAFDRAIHNLREARLFDAVDDAVRTQRMPILGICLGMQLLSKSSEEGQEAGFGWIDARTIKFRFPPDAPRKIPHMGWRDVAVARASELFTPSDSARFYFVHSYHVECGDPDVVTATATYGHAFTAAIQQDHIFGVQFHPEKSHKFGMTLLRRFSVGEAPVAATVTANA